MKFLSMGLGLLLAATAAHGARDILPFTEYYGYPGYNPLKDYGLDCHAYCKNNWVEHGDGTAYCVYGMQSARGMPRTTWTAWPDYRPWVWADLDGISCQCGLSHPITGDCSIYITSTHMQYKEAHCADGAKPKKTTGCDIPIYDIPPDIDPEYGQELEIDE